MSYEKNPVRAWLDRPKPAPEKPLDWPNLQPLPAWAEPLRHQVAAARTLRREAVGYIDSMANARKCDHTLEFRRRVDYDFAFNAAMEAQVAFPSAFTVAADGPEVRLESPGGCVVFRHTGKRSYLPCDGPRDGVDVLGLAHLPDAGAASWTARVAPGGTVTFIHIETDRRVSPAMLTPADLEAAENESRRMAEKRT